MSQRIELLTVLGSAPAVMDAEREWRHGGQRTAVGEASDLRRALSEVVADTDAEAVLCLDAGFPLPDDPLIARLLAGPSDAWHAGLRLGLEGQPRLLDRVSPLWMLNAPLDPTIETTSWRLSLRALLVRTRVLGQLGGPEPGYETLAGAGLDVGLRWIRSGALIRHVPNLVPVGSAPDEVPTDADGIRLIGRHFGRLWAGWGLQRAVITRDVGVRSAAALGRLARASNKVPLVHYTPAEQDPGSVDRTVSVIIPTIDRYAYLEPLLHQLAAQTVAPHQVIVADQTPTERRRKDLTDVEPDLPVTVIGLPSPGQSTARNAALRQATGQLVLFIDDDDEIGPALLEGHLQRLVEGVDASCGGVNDATAGPPPEGFRHRRASDVFPTNNAMLCRAALARSGLFDLTYDRGSRADHDLGMRLHLSGALLVYDPGVMVFHHHAPAGGLRTHGARAITRAGSRRSLLTRNLPSETEQYLALRFFTRRQNREDRVLRLASLPSGDGSWARRMTRALVQIAMLPASAKAIERTTHAAECLLADRPVIPALTDPSSDSSAP